MPTRVTATATPPAAAKDKATATAAAVAWVKLWARPKIPAKAWVAQLRPGTYVEYAHALVTVNPANVPATRLGKTKPIVVRFVPAAAHVRVPTAGGSIRGVDVTLIFYPVDPSGRWLVNGLSPVG